MLSGSHAALSLFLAALTSSDALVLGPATARRLAPTAAARSPSPRLGFLDDLFKPKSLEDKAKDLLGSVRDNPAGLSEEEFVALKMASICDEAPARGEEQYTKIPDAHPSLLLDAFPYFPLTYYVLLRNTRNMDPSPQAWDAIRKRWPVLAERTDEELMLALGPIKAQTVDSRVI
tara:strand:+ start:56 stop:580 length:525 start_codon:yes stop_codon:yes gene_type:complete